MKSYLYLAFFFMVMTYLTPKEQYRRYFRFMLGVFLAVIILKPLAAGYEYDMRFAELTKKIEGISYEYLDKICFWNFILWKCNPVN